MASAIEWIAGHSYLTYGPLLVGASLALFEGKPVAVSDPGIWWRTCEKYNVKGLSAALTALRALIKEGSNGEYIKKADFGQLKSIFNDGERLGTPTLKRLTEPAPKSV